MPKADDPFYNRKPVPDELIRDVGLTGLTKQEEYANRERKYSVDGVDVRRFGSSSSGGWKPVDDPYYGRKSVKKPEIDGVGDTGLSPDQEFENRERKYSVNGVDVRRFGSTSSGGWKPVDDPYYGRKPVSKNLTQGLGETGQTEAEEFAVRERKQSMVNFSSDPFQLVTGRGQRQSVSGGGALEAAKAATERRRSSAVGPHAAAAAAQATHHSGFDGDKLAPIESKPDLPPVANVTGTRDEITSEGSTTVPSNTSGSGTAALGSAAPGANGHTNYYDSATTGHDHAGAHQHFDDPDSVAPHEVR